MLPQFRVPLDEAVMVQEDDLRGTVIPIFEKMGSHPRGRPDWRPTSWLWRTSGVSILTACPTCCGATCPATKAAR